MILKKTKNELREASPKPRNRKKTVTFFDKFICENNHCPSSTPPNILTT